MTVRWHHLAIVTGGVFALATVLLASAGADDAAKDNADKEKIQGTWEIVLVKRDERVDELKREVEVVITADEFKVRVGDKSAEFTYKIDPDAKVKTIDMFSPKKIGELKELGIYKLEGDTLTICNCNANKKERPKEFENKDGNGTTLTVLKRVKK